MKYYIIAGEASGDLHASNLMRGLMKCDPECEIRFWGGDAMASVGGTMVGHCRDTAVMGLVEVAAKAGQILRRMSFCKEDILAWSPDAVILVDYPGFNMRIARFARSRGFKVFYYIAPKVWAHKTWRVRSLRRNVDALYCIFPFEPEWFRRHGVEPLYFGNPLLDVMENHEFRPVGEGGVIALLAGSREMELKFLMPRFVALEKLLDSDRRLSAFRLVLACAPSLPSGSYRRYLPQDSRIELVQGRTYDVLRQASAAVISSGTASLEAALIGTPQLVCYGMHPLTYAIARPVVCSHIRHISLSNLILDRRAFAELIQAEASPANMKKELERLLLDPQSREKLLADYAELKGLLGGPGASDRAAEDMYEKTARLQVSGRRQ